MAYEQHKRGWGRRPFGSGDEPLPAHDPRGELDAGDRGTSREGYGDYEPRGGYGFGNTLPRHVGDPVQVRGSSARRSDEVHPASQERRTGSHWGRPAPGLEPRALGGTSTPEEEGPYVGVGPQNYRRSDERILEDVAERLTRHGQINASGMRVEVSEGEVTLEGRVGEARMKSLAEDVADSVSGVRDVHNRLRVERAGAPGDH